MDKVTIGFPHDNVRCYITNALMQQQPVGVVGELCLAGANVTGGYLNSPDLTASKYLRDPFNTTSPFTSLYRTGDLAVRLADGSVLFKGRRDDQVKVHGFRIELSEIQTAVEAFPGVQDAAVLLRDGKLVCYVTPESLDRASLRKFLADRLPYYMLPAHTVALDKFPLNKNSKLDRAALPLPFNERTMSSESTQSIEQNGLTTKSEMKVAKVLKATLKLKSDQLMFKNDGFFDLGGTSLSAVMVARRASEEFGVDVPVTLIFEKQDIASLAAEIERMANKHEQGLPGFFAGLHALGIVHEKPLHWARFGAAQLLYVLWLSLVHLLPGLGGVLGFWFVLARSGWPLYMGMLACPALLLGAIVASALLILASKWLLIGRLAPGVYPMCRPPPPRLRSKIAVARSRSDGMPGVRVDMRSFVRLDAGLLSSAPSSNLVCSDGE